MATGEAFCVEVGRNVTIIEARDIYFSQPEPRSRLNFKCGDARCRVISSANVIGANYDKEENSELKIQSPHFRENCYHAHISTCTWIESGEGDKSNGAARHNKRTSQAAAESGMIFRPFPKKKKTKNPTEKKPEYEDIPHGSTHTKGAKNPSSAEKTKRPESSRFVSTIAMNHLRFNDDQRKNSPLRIEGIADGTFNSICMPIKGFHPAYQNCRIYYGRCTVVSLDYVFLIQFQSKISPTGDKTNRESTPQVKLQKKWLAGNSALLAIELEKLARSEEIAWCYFYSQDQPDVAHDKFGKTQARFSISEPGHIAVIPVSELTEPEPEGNL